MKTCIQKWGNSLALRIPAVYAKEINLREGSNVELLLDKDSIRLRPLADVPEYSLEELLTGITEENAHGEIDTGPPMGNEEW